MKDMLIPDLSAVILAGGQSRRMGRNKALLAVDGMPLIQKLAHELELLTDQIFISANDPVPFAFLRLPVIADLYPGRGPLGGLHSAILRSNRPMMLLLACDLPGVQEPFLRRLVAAIKEYDAVIPQTSDSRVHPLCAVYRRSCLPAIEQNLKAGRNKMTAIFDSGLLKVRYLSAGKGSFRDEDLCNLNSPLDLREWKRDPR